VAMTIPLHGYDWVLLGLMFDVCGSLVLATGLLFKRLIDARYESLTVLGGNSALVRGAMLQEGDAIAGLAPGSAWAPSWRSRRS
jgi:hypothetical protein